MKKLSYIKSLLIIFILTLLLSSCASVGTGNYDVTRLSGHYRQVALLLPLNGPYGGEGTAIRNGFLAGYYASLKSGNPATTIKVYDTNNQADIRDVYNQAISEGAQVVIGPLVKKDVSRVANANIRVPTIALNYTLSSNSPSLFFKFGISPQNEASQIATKAYSSNANSALIIALKAGWAEEIVSTFSEHWQKQGGNIAATLFYEPNQNLNAEIRNLLNVSEKKMSTKRNSFIQRRQDFNMVFLVAPPELARQIVPLLRFYYVNNIPIYSTSMIYQGTPEPAYYRDMNGVIFSDIPWIFNLSNNPSVQNNIKQLWAKPYQNYARLYALGLDAFTLSQDLNHLPSNPQSGFIGNTGKIYLSNNNNIYQQYSWAEFQDGQAVRIN